MICVLFEHPLAAWLLLITLAVGTFLVWLKYADADLPLVFLSKFGRSPGVLKGSVVWITGASSGIGESLSYELARAGAKLALSGTNTERLRAVKDKCIAMAKDTQVILVPFDLSDFSCHERQLKAVVDHYGRVDVLVNNAGRVTFEEFEEFTYEDDRALFDVNAFGPVSLTRLTLKHSMQQQRRLHVVVNSSMSAMQGGRSCSVYAATKSALQGYFSSLRLQGRMTGAVDVTVVFPGPVLTPIQGDVEKLKKVSGEGPGCESQPQLRLLPS
ncbi:dehydrogenase, putative [Ixodes scapularis]|uniref:Dehydrogenase, putative n=1 Tax=Ixodes scapularis TaxID=6945 RepID=B7PKH5_IXOSC|nr:dehydrogenase, putative [Ixodes scapularis]|eukprot:XP_002400214.1 dehydrogenase, putative [Ixodes scapularis]